MKADMPIRQATTTTSQGAVRPAPRVRSNAEILARRARQDQGFAILRQLLVQLFLLIVLITVLFPVVWIFSMAIDPRGIARPTDLNLFPANANLDAFYALLAQPFSNVLPVYFGDMLMNSLFVALGTALYTVTLGASAAYSFSRFRFVGRQTGLLTFIVLLMLPSTGSLIPLFILFNSVQVNTVLAVAPPAYFSAAVVAGIIFIVYRMVINYGRHDPERRYNPPGTMIVAAVALLAFLTIFGAIAVMFERSPVYAAAIDAPLTRASAPIRAAQEEFNRRASSLPRAEGTALRAERAQEAAQANVDALTALSAEAAGAADLNAFLTEALDDRAGESGIVVDTLTTALAADGREAALAELAAGLASAEATLVNATDSAQRGRQQAIDAEASLRAAEETLFDEQERFGAVEGEIAAIRNGTLLQLFPYYLIAWVGALAGAAVVWGLVYAARHIIEPRTLVNLLAWALLLSIIIGLGTMALQARLANARVGDMVTLRTTLFGLSLAFASGGLPFAIWNLKGYFDTIPKDLEEAARIDGAGRLGTFFRVMLPLSLPAFAITILFSFMGSWTEYILSWVFLTGNTQDYTLAMALVSMANGSNTAPPDMQKFAAMSILISMPILFLFFAAQRWIVSGLTIGAVK